MRPGPSIALKLLAGSASLALSVRGWHSPEMAVLGGALLLRAGFDLERKRPTTAPPTPLHHVRVRWAPLFSPTAALGRRAHGESRRGPSATGAATRPRSAWTANGSPPGRADQRQGGRQQGRPPQRRPAVLTPGSEAGRIGPVPASRTTGSEDP